MPSKASFGATVCRLAESMPEVELVDFFARAKEVAVYFHCVGAAEAAGKRVRAREWSRGLGE